MIPAITTATGTISTPRSSDDVSDSMPMSGGEGMSPRKCITKTDSPSAVARSHGATALMIAELIGPVLMNMNTSATTIAGRYTERRGSLRATQVTGAASSVTMPESQRYDCFDHFKK